MTTTVQRVVHASVLIDFGGARILTDPWLSERKGYHQGEPRSVQSAAELPPLAGIVISHGHYDHCDLDALAGYPDKTVPFAVVRGLAGRVRAVGFTDVTELDPWQSTRLGPVRVTATPAQHGVPEVTFVLQHDRSSVFFGADTLRIPALDEVARRFPDLDLALLPINGLRIRPAFNRQVVMDAVQAAELTRALRPRLAVPIHYAFTAGRLRDATVLKLTRNRPDLYRDAAADLAPDTAVHILTPGEPLSL
ncbi:L-ascorbate metabolism protein UlaG (beta-lactamase superfamily) [Kitasatospora gansuensis]|uniref:L-ascorbate metabolism protein UlaG (Beta-lactamase superfamily) n=1 Tax=Kitasatospora gansuensis TaxID=258050 RepID=A0A7W7SJM2_9ACTN|nr:MBL fold metallo-hydrolase [Kitasatospora gansuensis]MBB4951681.1 L-ascorbate metabolism protein UlaG (beta-lactamase superfamily) [Kitasatospora gansuensis]